MKYQIAAAVPAIRISSSIVGIRHITALDIEFADGTTSIGYVDRFYSATYILPEEFQKKFEPTTRTLAADILPLTPDDLERWKKYYKLSVTITKRTF